MLVCLGQSSGGHKVFSRFHQPSVVGLVKGRTAAGEYLSFEGQVGSTIVQAWRPTGLSLGTIMKHLHSHGMAMAFFGFHFCHRNASVMSPALSKDIDKSILADFFRVMYRGDWAKDRCPTCTLLLPPGNNQHDDNLTACRACLSRFHRECMLVGGGEEECDACFLNLTSGILTASLASAPLREMIGLSRAGMGPVLDKLWSEREILETCPTVLPQFMVEGAASARCHMEKDLICVVCGGVVLNTPGSRGCCFASQCFAAETFCVCKDCSRNGGFKGISCPVCSMLYIDPPYQATKPVQIIGYPLQLRIPSKASGPPTIFTGLNTCAAGLVVCGGFKRVKFIDRTSHDHMADDACWAAMGATIDPAAATPQATVWWSQAKLHCLKITDSKSLALIKVVGAHLAMELHKKQRFHAYCVNQLGCSGAAVGQEMGAAMPRPWN